MTEQTLDACQTKRQRSDQVAVEMRYICRHLQQWQLLGKELTLQVGSAAQPAGTTAAGGCQATLLHVPLCHSCLCLDLLHSIQPALC